jgi:hypothetical protein
MPCICHGAVSGDEMLDKLIKTPEYKKANALLKEAASIIHHIPIDMECYPTSFYDAWCTAFRHHLRGCNERH